MVGQHLSRDDGAVADANILYDDLGRCNDKMFAFLVIAHQAVSGSEPQAAVVRFPGASGAAFKVQEAVFNPVVLEVLAVEPRNAMVRVSPDTAMPVNEYLPDEIIHHPVG